MCSFGYQQGFRIVGKVLKLRLSCQGERRQYIRSTDLLWVKTMHGLAGKFLAVMLMLVEHRFVVAVKDIEAAVYAIEDLEETAKLARLLGCYVSLR